MLSFVQRNIKKIGPLKYAITLAGMGGSESTVESGSLSKSRLLITEARASSTLRTGVLPRRCECFGSRTVGGIYRENLADHHPIEEASREVSVIGKFGCNFP